jgi:hypothetical protein
MKMTVGAMFACSAEVEKSTKQFSCCEKAA